MGKYICLCGVDFRKKSDADLHAKLYEELALIEGFSRHKILIQHWQARFAKWVISLDWGRVTRFFGAYMIYIVLIFHFHISWEWWEAVLIGLGMGLYIE